MSNGSARLSQQLPVSTNDKMVSRTSEVVRAVIQMSTDAQRSRAETYLIHAKVPATVVTLLVVNVFVGTLELKPSSDVKQWLLLLSNCVQFPVSVSVFVHISVVARAVGSLCWYVFGKCLYFTVFTENWNCSSKPP